MSGMTKRITVVVCLVLAGSLGAPLVGAQAQVPGLPPVPAPAPPAIPAPVLDAVDTAGDTAVPVLVDAAKQAQPVSNAGGPAFRPACVQGGTIALALGLAGLPIDPAIVTKPLVTFCKGALKAGPTDPVFATVDAAAGPQVQTAVEPVLVQANPVIEQARPQAAPVCLVLGLAVPSLVVPPPAHRFNVTREACWR